MTDAIDQVVRANVRTSAPARPAVAPIPEEVAMHDAVPTDRPLPPPAAWQNTGSGTLAVLGWDLEAVACA
jgi:hypothetical protein